MKSIQTITMNKPQQQATLKLKSRDSEDPIEKSKRLKNYLQKKDKYTQEELLSITFTAIDTSAHLKNRMINVEAESEAKDILLDKAQKKINQLDLELSKYKYSNLTDEHIDKFNFAIDYDDNSFEEERKKIKEELVKDKLNFLSSRYNFD
uniref:Uncharacterized protein n=1 Tax=Moumouvirus sp. 'Monve' TaxID=1128131 RepID=H6WBE8_9VIRU|nr:hypothetical protein tv_L4 [Moumouvirus Monve]